MKDNGYINIQGWMITRLKLKGNELILFAMVHGFSQDGVSEFHGSISYVMSALGLTSNNTVISLYKKLIDKNFIICRKDNHSGNRYRANLEVVHKVHEGGAESASLGGAESAHNINNTINKDKDTMSESSKKEMKELFDFWNESKGLVTHSIFSKPMKDILAKRLKQGYTPEGIAKTIVRYENILTGEGYWLTKRWTFLEFMKQDNAMPKMHDLQAKDYKKNIENKKHE
tara:strand:+ start:477 stop:1163 length:687 start_codon:yes stop_codon:yes gene_type:complete